MSKPTPAFCPLNDEDLERVLVKYGLKNDFLGFGKFLVEVRDLVATCIRMNGNRSCLFAEDGTTMSLIELPKDFNSQYEKLVKSCGIIVRATVFLQTHFGKNDSQNRLLIFSQPDKPLWFYVAEIDWSSMGLTKYKRKLVSDFKLFLKHHTDEKV